MTISKHNIEAWVGTQRLGVISGDITMDESWAPYVQGSITIPLDMDILDSIDPRTGARIKVFISQEYGESDKLSVITTNYSGQTLAAISTEYAGKTLADLSAWYFAPYNQPGSNKLDTLSNLFTGGTLETASTAWDGLLFEDISEQFYRSYPDGINNNHERGLDLTVRSRTLDVGESTITIELASDEALMLDFAHVGVNNFAPASQDLRTIVKEVLSKIGDALVDGAVTSTVDSAAIIWQPGQTAWDYLNPLVKKAGLRLYCDEKRLWHLVTDTDTLPGLVELFSVGTIKSTAEVIDRNSDEWFDAVVIKYSYVNDLGQTVNAFDTAAENGYSKVKLIEFDTPFPGLGAAQRILDRALARGSQQDVTAVSNYAVTPSTQCTIYITGFPALENYIKSVTWNFPSDEMTIKTRQLITS